MERRERRKGRRRTSVSNVRDVKVVRQSGKEKARGQDR